jgi:hypothetical protein
LALHTTYVNAIAVCRFKPAKLLKPANVSIAGLLTSAKATMAWTEACDDTRN